MAKANGKPNVSIGGAASSRLVNQLAKKPSGIAPPDDMPHVGGGGGHRVRGVNQSPAGPPPHTGQIFDNGARTPLSADGEDAPTPPPSDGHAQMDREHVRQPHQQFTGPGGFADRSALLNYFDHLRSRVNRQFDHVYDHASRIAGNQGLDMPSQDEFGEGASEVATGAAPHAAPRQAPHQAPAPQSNISHLLPPGTDAHSIIQRLHEKFGPDFMNALGLHGGTNG